MRLWEFAKVLWREGFHFSFIYTFTKGFFHLLPYWLNRGGKERREWQRRYRVCLKCPLFDAQLKRCKPFDASERGCGCYVPFSNLFYDECWGRMNYGSPFGWSKYDEGSKSS